MFGNKSPYPIVIIPIEYQLLCTAHDARIDGPDLVVIWLQQDAPE
jgi:hypothetical protein